MCNDDGEPMKKGTYYADKFIRTRWADLPYRHQCSKWRHKDSGQICEQGKIDGEGYQAYSPVCRDCENIGRSSNKVLKNVIKKGDIKKENGSISATKMESTGTVNMYSWTLDGSGLLVPIFAIRGRPTTLHLWGLSTDQMDGTEMTSRSEGSVGIRHEFITEGREDGSRERAPKISEDVSIRLKLRLSVTFRKNRTKHQQITTEFEGMYGSHSPNT
jgi:hypothetical protein